MKSSPCREERVAEFILGLNYIRNTLIVLAVCLTFCMAATRVFGYKADITGICIKVSDGDTILVQHYSETVSVRLYGIDCPELRQAFGDEAREFTKKRLLNQKVRVCGLGLDKYGRLLAWVWFDEECINELLVAEGLAWWYRKYAANERFLKVLEEKAKRANKGLWSRSDAKAPWDFRKKLRQTTTVH